MARTDREQPIADDKYGTLFSIGSPFMLQAAFQFIGRQRPSIERRALIAAVVTWLPLAVLTAMRGNFVHESADQSFLFDFGVHARFLVAVPILILADALCPPRLGATVRHFVNAGLVSDAERTRFDTAVASAARLRDSKLAEMGIVVLAYAIVASLVYSYLDADVQGWHRSDSGMGLNPSPAGWWGLLVSLPILLILVLRWFWRLTIFTRFLGRMARLDLRLIPSHPDGAAGLMFLSYSLRAWWPLAFAFGVIAAGQVVTFISHRGADLLDYRYMILGVAAFSVAIFVAPLLLFFAKLVKGWWRGVFEYNELVGSFGRHLESRWLRRGSPVEESILDRPDFSTANDFYQVVDRVLGMRLVPVDLRSVFMLTSATLLPFVPVVLLDLPLDAILSSLAALLL